MTSWGEAFGASFGGQGGQLRWGVLGGSPERKDPGRKPDSSLAALGRGQRRGGQRGEGGTQGTDIDQVPRVSPRAWLPASCALSPVGL